MAIAAAALASASALQAQAAAATVSGLVCRVSTSYQTHSPADTIVPDGFDPNAPFPPGGGGGGGGGGAGGAGGAGGGGGGRGGARGAGGLGGPGGRGPQLRRLVMSAQIANGRAHMDVSGQAGNGVELTLNDYLIVTDTDQSIVDFSAHTYRNTTLSTGSVVDMINALNRHEPVIMTKLKFDTLKTAAGDTVDGLPTTHYQLKLEYRGYQNDSLNELKQASTTMTSDYWVADKFPVRFKNPWIGLALPKPGYSPGLKIWIDKIQAIADVINSGTTLRYVTNGEDHIEWPRPNIFKRDMEITGCTPKDLDAALFKIPDGYTVRAGRGGGGGGGGGR